VQELEPPMERALELAWESLRAGSLGVGATVSRHGDVIATGRNRMAERDPGDDVLAGTSLAHAEMNALAKLRWGMRADGLELWTTLQPCLQCLGAIRLSPVPRVHVLAPDPLFRGIERVRELNKFVGRRWPEIVEVRADEWAALSLLLHTHFVTFWGVTLDGWDEALPSIAGLAHDLVDSGELIHLAVEAAPVAETAAVLWDRLGACVPDVERIAATLPT
jgi:tRNA(adenine34) deaminase